MITLEQLKEFEQMDIMELDRAQLANAEDIVIDTEADVWSRVRSFIEQTGNPYAQNVGNYILKTGFQEGSGASMNDRMILLAKRKAQITIH